MSSLKKLVETDIISMLTPRRQLVMGWILGQARLRLRKAEGNEGAVFLQKFGVKLLNPR